MHGATERLCNSTTQRENKGVQCPALPLRNAIGTGALEARVASAFAFEGECIRIASRSATFLLKPALGMREDEGTDPASRRGIPSSEELEVVSSLLLSTPASSLLLDMPPLHKGTGHVAEGTRHAAKGTRHAAKGTRHAAEGTRHAAEGTRYAAEGTRGRPIVFRGRPIVLREKQWASPEKERAPPTTKCRTKCRTNWGTRPES